MVINLTLPKLKKEKTAAPENGQPEDTGKKGKKKDRKLKKGKMPSKRHINLIARKKKVPLKKSLPVIILLAVVLIVFCKFMVFDRLATVMSESSQVAELQQEILDTNHKIDALSDVDDTYAHYTISGMTDEELSRVDRVKAMKLIDKAFLHGNVSKSWNLTGNVMTLQVTGASLKGLNQLASELESKPIVERCVISTADKGESADGKVAVTFVIYLQQPEEE